MIECFFCHKPHNTQLHTGRRMHPQCQNKLAAIIQREFNYWASTRRLKSLLLPEALDFAQAIEQGMEEAEK